MIEVFKAELNIDLSSFTEQLWKLKIRHRVVFDQQQILIVEDEQSAELVLQLYRHWQVTGEFPKDVLDALDVTGKRRASGKKSVDLKKIPLVITLLLLSLLLSMAVEFGANTQSLKYFTITDFEILSYQINYYSLSHNFDSGQLWRFISPIFIHFNVPHIIFNALWIWLVGAVIEQRQGTLTLLFIVVFSALASNIAQYYVSGPVFGGLSGVVYAVICYAWLWDKWQKDKLAVVSNGLMGFMIFWLVLGYTGLLGKLGLGNIANTAHLVGLISGLLAVPIIAFITMRKTRHEQDD